jgi:hypothetical protein
MLSVPCRLLRESQYLTLAEDINSSAGVPEGEASNLYLSLRREHTIRDPECETA